MLAKYINPCTIETPLNKLLVLIIAAVITLKYPTYISIQCITRASSPGLGNMFFQRAFLPYEMSHIDDTCMVTIETKHGFKLG